MSALQRLSQDACDTIVPLQVCTRINDRLFLVDSRIIVHPVGLGTNQKLLSENVFSLNTCRKMSSNSNAGGNSATNANPHLIKHVPGMDVGKLESWPFDNPKSSYVIHDGTSPQASGRIDHSTATTRTGIWKCTVGKMECKEQGDELMTILSGSVEVTDVNSGQVVMLKPGDSMCSYNGKRVIWNVLEDVTKVFYGFKADGYS